MTKRIKIVCGECGSEDCGRDATARWCVETQDWELSCVQDDAWCDGECAGERVRLVEVELEDQTEPAPKADALAAVVAALKRWEQFARDNLWTEEDLDFLAATREALALAVAQ